MKSRTELRHALEALAGEVARVGGAAPLVIVCSRVDRDAAGRRAGVYYRRGVPEVVFQTDAERQELVAELVPEGAHPPLAIVRGSRVVKPPKSLPEPPGSEPDAT